MAELVAIAQGEGAEDRRVPGYILRHFWVSTSRGSEGSGGIMKGMNRFDGLSYVNWSTGSHDSAVVWS